MMDEWTGKRVVILGAARQGLALARWLAQHGAKVTLSDMRPEEQLAEARAMLEGVQIRWICGGHPPELLDDADVLCLSGGIPMKLPIVQEALRRGIPLSNDTQIFMEVVPCKTVGITGSAGKTTTTALVGNMAQRAMAERRAREGSGTTSSTATPSAFVGGNIGDPLINHVDEMKASDLAILEISSFQLEQMTRSPNVAAILNITPNHLDRHGTMEAYTAAKARILEFQTPADKAVLGRDDPGAWGLRAMVKGGLSSFGMSRKEVLGDGAYYDDGILYLSDRGVDIPLLRHSQVQLRGPHNVMNMLAAFAIGHAAGLPLDAMLNGAEEFQGMPHRLELVRELRGVNWFDDSIATAPERTMAAIRSFHEPLVLLLGGRDKDLPWDDLARLVHQRVDHVVIFGEAADKIEAALAATASTGAHEPRRRPHTIERAADLQEAIVKAHRTAETGDVVLLSPGGTSFDEFKDFEERGAFFREWVQELA
jgi:UDP-N-acetylmuramoylalanine--D-glutamate ligase